MPNIQEKILEKAQKAIFKKPLYEIDPDIFNKRVHEQALIEGLSVLLIESLNNKISIKNFHKMAERLIEGIEGDESLFLDKKIYTDLINKAAVGVISRFWIKTLQEMQDDLSHSSASKGSLEGIKLHPLFKKSALALNKVTNYLAIKNKSKFAAQVKLKISKLPKKEKISFQLEKALEGLLSLFIATIESPQLSPSNLIFTKNKTLFNNDVDYKISNNKKPLRPTPY